MQKDRHLAVFNRTMKGMVDSRESAILTAAAEAVTWRHALEFEEKTRKGQRVIIYPKEMTKLTEVLTTKNPNVDPEGGHQLAYSIILQTAQTHENPPLFMSEDNEQITSNEVMKESVAEWMNTAAKVATRNCRRVLEDGRDVMNSDEDDAIKDVEPDEEKGIYAPGCSSIEQARMTQEQAMAQRAAAAAASAQQQASEKVPTRSQTPVSGSSDDDDPNGAELIWSQSKHYWRPNKNRKAASPAPDIVPKSEPPRHPTSLGTPVNSAPQTKGPSRPSTPVSVPEDPPSPRGKKSTTKAAASQKAPAGKSVIEAKASKPMKGQESPATKVSKPMQTRRQAQEASRTGGLRSGAVQGKRIRVLQVATLPKPES
jgi:hypothetical protein